MNYVFDVDGTLTPSRERIDPEFERFFFDFCLTNSVYLVTGSDYEKTVEQLGTDICYVVNGIFNCSGNVLMRRGIEVYRNDFELTTEEEAALENELRKSGFSVRTGNHIEKRIGAVNFSIVGRNASKSEREAYISWDNATNERHRICKNLSNVFTRLDFVVGGETGIDIFLKGKDKAQVAEQVRPFTFFGDRCELGGNDHSIYLVADESVWVNNWKNTYQFLKDIVDENRSKT